MKAEFFFRKARRMHIVDTETSPSSQTSRLSELIPEQELATSRHVVAETQRGLEIQARECRVDTLG